MGASHLAGGARGSRKKKAKSVALSAGQALPGPYVRDALEVNRVKPGLRHPTGTAARSYPRGPLWLRREACLTSGAVAPAVEACRAPISAVDSARRRNGCVCVDVRSRAPQHGVHHHTGLIQPDALRVSVSAGCSRTSSSHSRSPSSVSWVVRSRRWRSRVRRSASAPAGNRSQPQGRRLPAWRCSPSAEHPAPHLLPCAGVEETKPLQIASRSFGPLR
jgi:hypothetical protein